MALCLQNTTMGIWIQEAGSRAQFGLEMGAELPCWQKNKDGLSPGTDLARRTQALESQCRRAGATPFRGPPDSPNSAFPEGHNPFNLSPHYTYTLHGNPVFLQVSSLLWAIARVSRLLISCPGQPLLPIPLHTHQLPWQEFCEFLVPQNTGPGLEEKMKMAMEKVHRYLRCPIQQVFLFFLHKLRGCAFLPTSVTSLWLTIMPLMLYCAIVLGKIMLLPQTEIPYSLALSDEEKWRKTTWPVRSPFYFSVDLVAAMFRRAAIFQNGGPLSYMQKTNLKLIKCDIFFVCNAGS